MNNDNRMRHPLIIAAALAGLTVGQALAQTYPSKPIRIVVAFAPGGFADGVARLVGQKMGDRLGQPVVVENRGGAGGNIGARQVVTSAQPKSRT